MSSIMIFIPRELEAHRENLAGFFDGMVRKLYRNRHKDDVTLPAIPMLMGLLQGECAEFEEQLEINKFDENSLIELMDVANFAYLAYRALRKEGVEHVGENKADYAPNSHR